MTSSLISWWNRAQNFPAGPWIFARVLGFAVPYTGTIRPKILELRPGYAKVALKDRRRVRNHLKSVHAIALMNLGEFSTGMALMAALSPNARAILTNLSIQFGKKARGLITAECCLEPIDETVRGEYQFISTLRNASGEVVSTATATWLVGPK